MYRQVRIKADEQRFQRILWRQNSSQPMKTYELCTITYGTASAPFLATRVLRQLGDAHLVESPMAGRAIISDFYVDDLLSGADTIEDARHLKSNITKILSTAGLELRKWAANDARILQEDNPGANVTLDAEKDPKTLGLLWSTNEDCLRCVVQPPPPDPITKRTILSQIAQIFDPLGLVGPAIIQAKMLMQELWQLKISWDESFPMSLHSQWRNFREELPSLNKLKIPRFVFGNQARGIQLHGFCDASERAYGASVYLRFYDDLGTVSCTLLCAKSRVAPLKTISLPRLELCGALLLSNLIAKIRSSLDLNIQEEYYWTDSTIVLAWLKGSSARWKTFVANRVTKIQQKTRGEWRHVPSQDNPADVISRGISPATLSTLDIWWHGPSWISQPASHWPYSSTEVDEIPEAKTTTTYAMVATATIDSTIFERHSSINKLTHVIAYCFRFINTLRSRITNRKPLNGKLGDVPAGSDAYPIYLSLAEISDAKRALIELAQKQEFSVEHENLSIGREIPSRSILASLCPFLDADGLLRVGGRLCNAPIAYNQQHPIILPAKHRLTILIITEEHRRLLHAGCHAVMASLRTEFWPISCKASVKEVIRSCIRCFRAKPVSPQYLMGQLPTDRVTPSRPFATCGVDYAGPFLIKERSRARTAIKAYLCIFVCFATKAARLELAVDMSTVAFLNCLKRFIARRERCNRIYSDNGSNFIGARNQFNELGILLADEGHNVKVQNYLNSERIQWHLIPPGSPNFGGLWESAVKSAKHHLKRVVGETRRTFEELYTVLTQVESYHEFSSTLCPIQ